MFCACLAITTIEASLPKNYYESNYSSKPVWYQQVSNTTSIVPRPISKSRNRKRERERDREGGREEIEIESVREREAGKR
jgi:hypothetical protein